MAQRGFEVNLNGPSGSCFLFSFQYCNSEHAVFVLALDRSLRAAVLHSSFEEYTNVGNPCDTSQSLFVQHKTMMLLVNSACALLFQCIRDLCVACTCVLSVS